MISIKSMDDVKKVSAELIYGKLIKVKKHTYIRGRTGYFTYQSLYVNYIKNTYTLSEIEEII